MKYLLFSIAVIILGCSSNSNTEIATENQTNNKKELTTADFNIDPIKGGPADITIKVNGVPQNFTSKLIGFYFDQNFLADTCRIQNGMIKFKKDEGYFQGFYYVSLPNEKYIQLMLGDDQMFTIECDFNNITRTMIVDGDEENKLYYESALFEEQMNPQLNAMSVRLKKYEKGSEDYERTKEQKLALDKKRSDYFKNILNKHPNSLFANFKFGGQNPELDESLNEQMQVVKYRQDFWKNVNFGERRLLCTPMIINKLKRYIEVLTPQNPDSIISAADHLMNRVENYPEYYKAFSNWIVKKYEPTKTTLMDPEAVFVHMIQNYFTHEKALWADSLTINTIQQRAFEMAQSLVGKDAPNVISTDTKGNKKELLDMKAPYLVVYMFNPDCEHCQEQTPKLIDYYKKMNGEIDVMAIAIETEEKLWKDYVKKTNMPFTSVFDPTNRSIYAKYYVDITPELYVINPDRKIIGKNLKVFQIQTIIDRDKQERGVK
jgi:peroxiredoxin